MKRFLAVLVIVQFSILFVWTGSSEAFKVAKYDEISDIIIKQNTPENTIKSLYQLIYANPGEAALIFSPEAKNDDGVIAKQIIDAYGDGSEFKVVLKKVFPAEIKNNVAIIGAILSIESKEVHEIYLELYTLERIGNSWYMASSSAVKNYEELLEVYKSAYRVVENIYNDSLEDFSDQQRGEIRGQLMDLASDVVESIEGIYTELNMYGSY